MNGQTLAGSPSPKALVVLGTLISIFFALNPQIIADWRIYSFDDGTYSHAYLIPFMSAYIAYVGWQQRSLCLRWSWVFFALTVTTLLFYQWVEFAHQRYLSRALVPACLTFALLAVLRPTRFVIATGAFFWFITPVWGPINELLQWSSVKAVNYFMSFSGIPTYVYDEFVQIPAGTFEIADGCSGLRYVIAALALVCFYGVIYLRQLKSIALLIALAIAGAMLTNWLRIVALILIGHFSDMQADIIKDHNMFGWFIFIPLMFLLFFIADRLEDEAIEENPALASDENQGTIRPFKFTLFFAVLIAFSGASVRLLAGLPPYRLPAFDVETATAAVLPTAPAPKIYAISDFGLSTEDQGASTKVEYRFYFDGSTDAHRAEFYLNDPVPDGWQILEEQHKGSSRVLEVAKRSDRALIELSYRVGQVETGSRGGLRLARLIAALELDRGSELFWSFTPCPTDCATVAAAEQQRAGDRRQTPGARENK